MVRYCTICLTEETLLDFAEGTEFVDVDDKTYCEKCFNNIEDRVVYCIRCDEREHKNENFDEHFVKMEDTDEINYCHTKCLSCDELCHICKKYMKIEECVSVFITYGFKVECCHKKCVSDKDSIFNYDMCDYCGISFRVECVNCKRKFRDCYNEDCKNYGYDEYREPGRYDGQCSECNW